MSKEVCLLIAACRHAGRQVSDPRPGQRGDDLPGCSLGKDPAQHCGSYSGQRQGQVRRSRTLHRRCTGSGLQQHLRHRSFARKPDNPVRVCPQGHLKPGHPLTALSKCSPTSMQFHCNNTIAQAFSGICLSSPCKSLGRNTSFKPAKSTTVMMRCFAICETVCANKSLR